MSEGVLHYLTFIVPLLGRPYAPDFTCWHLVELIERELFGRAIDVGVPAGLSAKAHARMIEAHPERANWREVAAPEPGSIAMMTKVDREMHAGVWLPLDRGGVLHCDAPHGVVFEPVADLLSRGYRAIRFYEPKA